MSRKRVFPDVWRDSTGAVAVVLAVTLPVFVGGLGLGAEVGYWYFGQRKVQNAADVAAYAGAVALRAGVGKSKMDDAAGDAAAESGFRVDRGEIEVVTPPTTGTYAGDTNAVEVRLVERLPRLFSAIFKSGEVDVPGLPLPWWAPVSRRACSRSTAAPPVRSPSLARPEPFWSAATCTPTRCRAPLHRQWLGDRGDALSFLLGRRIPLPPGSR